MKNKLIKLQDKFILVSDEDLQVGDLVYSKSRNKICKVTGRSNWSHKNDYSIDLDGENYYIHHSYCKKIISENPDFSLLSEEDCKIIGWVDVEKLWLHFNRNHNNDTAMGKSQFIRAYEYITAQSLNDKNCFSLEDMKDAIRHAVYTIDPMLLGTTEYNVEENRITQSLQQKSWDVEVEMKGYFIDGKNEVLGEFIGVSKPKITNNSIKVTKIL